MRRTDPMSAAAPAPQALASGSALRPALGRLYRLLPPSRRTRLRCRGAWKLAARKLVSPLLDYPVVLESPPPARVRMVVSADPVDERIVETLLGRQRALYFPDLAGDWTPKLVLDIGAHHGFYALFALATYPGARIVCVEPSAAAATLLVRNLEFNGWSGRATIRRAALAARPGVAELKHSLDGSWGHSLLEPDASATGTERVETATFAELVGDLRPDLVKSNAEGAEFELVRQLAAGGWRPPLVVLAVHPWLGDEGELLATMDSLGYTREQVGSPQRPMVHFRRASP